MQPPPRRLATVATWVAMALAGCQSATVSNPRERVALDGTGWILSGNPILGTVDSANPHSGNFAADLVEIGVASRKPDGTLEYDPGASNTMVVIIGDNGTYSQSVRRHLTSYTPKAGSTKQASGFLSLCLDR